MKCLKAELKQAMYMILTDTLPNIECQKVKKEGNWDCDRCDDCMFEQYIKKVREITYIDKSGITRCKECCEPIEKGYCTCERS